MGAQVMRRILDSFICGAEAMLGFRLSRLVAALSLNLFLIPAVSAQRPRAVDPVIVTAARLPQPLSQTLAAVSVIDREAIEASASVDLLDLLRRVPGLDIVRGAGLGQQTSVFLRGSNSNHSLVLIDGVRVASLGTGAYAWEQLPLARIERIEIVRGPRAALWGADALAGVIQIFTRRQEAAQGAVQAGNHATYAADWNQGWRSGQGGFGLALGRLDTRGTNASTPAHWQFDPDRDGARFDHAGLWGEARLGGQQLRAGLLHNEGDVEFDRGRSSTRQQVAMLALEGELAPRWSHHLSLGGHRDRLDTPDSFSRYLSRRTQMDWRQQVDAGRRGHLNLGLSWLQEHGRQVDTGGGRDVYRQSRQNRALSLAWQGQWQRHVFELSGRHDHSSLYHGTSSFAAAWGVQAGAGWRFSASWGQGFRAPTMNELYSPGWNGDYAGNPELSPERSRSVELGLDLDAGQAGDFALHLFRTDIGQMIDFSGPRWQAINIARARIDGAELEWHWQSRHWDLQANATWQDARQGKRGEALLRRPARKASVLFERRFESGLRLGLEGMAVSDRPDFGVRLPGYGLLSLRAEYALGRQWRLQGRVENLLDREYVLVHGYATPGMTALLSLRRESH